MRSILVVMLFAVSCVATSAASPPRFELPYDLVVARDGSIYVTDRSRILRLTPKNGRVVVHRRVTAQASS